MSRRCKLTPEVHQQIVTFIRGGCYVETACAAAGVHKDSFYEWLSRAKRDGPRDKPFVAFARDVEAALAQSESIDIARINTAAQAGVWQAAAWRLERRFPKRWSRCDNVRLSGPDGGPVEVEVNVREQTDEDLEIMAGRRPAGAPGAGGIGIEAEEKAS